MNAIGRGIDRLVAAASIAAALLVIFQASAIFIGVAWRNLAGHSLDWPTDIIGPALVAVVMLGGADTYRRDGHLSVDLLHHWLPRRSRRWLGVWADASVIAVCVLLIWKGWQMVSFAVRVGLRTPDHLDWPVWSFQMFVPIGAALLLLAALRAMATRLAGDQTTDGTA